LGVEQLEYADDVIFVVFHWDYQHGLRPVTGGFVIFARAGKIEPLGFVNIGNIDDVTGNGRMGGDIGVIRPALLII